MCGHTADVAHRPVNSYREASPSRVAPPETHPVAPEKSLEDPKVTRKGDLDPKVSIQT